MHMKGRRTYRTKSAAKKKRKKGMMVMGKKGKYYLKKYKR